MTLEANTEVLAPEATGGIDGSASRPDPPAGRPTAELVASLADIPFPLEVELDRKNMSIEEILSLVPGSVLKMARSAGENIDIRVGGALLGFGEIVILEDTMGVRITDFRGED